VNALKAGLVHDLPDGIYGYRIRELLADLSPEDRHAFWYPHPGPAPARDPQRPAGLSDIPAGPRAYFQRGVALARGGFADVAREELNRAIEASPEDPTFLDVTAALAVRFEMYTFAMTTARRALARAEPGPARDRLWRYVYTLGHFDLIRPAAESNGLDPMLVAALIRQESLFDPRALSRAGARGLMQLMLPTARMVARSRGEPAPGEEDLFRPELSVTYGTHYLRAKLAEFDDRVEVALAAYNAGERKAREWEGILREFNPDLYREIIDYSETKDYVRRILYNQATFHLFYSPGEQSP
jgi:soluble lytic murein transglycosylase